MYLARIDDDNRHPGPPRCSEALAMEDATRRDLLKRSAFAAPAILTLAAVPAFARAGSTNGGKDKEKDKKPKQKD